MKAYITSIAFNGNIGGATINTRIILRVIACVCAVAIAFHSDIASGTNAAGIKITAVESYTNITATTAVTFPVDQNVARAS